MEDGKSRILRGKLIAIIRGIPGESVLNTAEAVLKGGISCLEIALDHRSSADLERSYEMIRLLTGRMGTELFVGAGTVLTAQEAEQCADAGAAYIISPNTDRSVILKTKELGLISMPGAMTPSEAVLADRAGADIVKIFPAGALGVSYIKALRSPLKHIAMAAVGGVSPENCREFLDAGCCCVGVGGRLADPAEIERGNFQAITRLAREYVNAVG